MKKNRNRAVVVRREAHLNTYKRKEYFWGLISHQELIHVKDMGWDLVIRVEDKPKHIYLQVGENIFIYRLGTKNP